MEELARREIRRYAVARAITCPVTGQVMNVKNAVLIESATSGQTLAVLSPAGWRRCRDDLIQAHESGRLRISVDNVPADAPFSPAPEG